MIAFLINDLDIRGGTHKQFLKMLDYMSSTEIDFIVITRVLDFDKTFPGFKNSLPNKSNTTIIRLRGSQSRKRLGLPLQ